MARLNTRRQQTQLYSPIRTADTTPDTRTHEGGAGYTRDARSELFILGVSLLAGEDTFYESANTRNARFVGLVNHCTSTHPTWTAAFLRWLRHEGNIRTASIIGGAEFVRAVNALHCSAMGCPKPVNWWSARAGWWCDAHGHGKSMAQIRPRAVVDSVIVRADETGEMVSYWLSTYGRSLPMAIKRGVADAMIRLGTERNAIKWDSQARGVRLADVLNLTHPGDLRGARQRLRGNAGNERGGWQDQLFAYLTTSPYVDDLPIPETLGMLTRRQALMQLPVEQRRAYLDPNRLEEAGITWESLAGWLQGPMDAQAWQAIIPSMGYMALLRNLRNFDEAGIHPDMVAAVQALLMDGENVAHSRQLPYRFLSAAKTVPSSRWAWPLEVALDKAVANIPALSGRTLILCDTSGSMENKLSAKSQMTRVEAAALFAVALAYRCGPSNVDLYGFGTSHFSHNLAMGGSVLRQLAKFTARVGEAGHATMTGAALSATFAGQHRVVIFTDEQTHDRVDSILPADTWCYTFNLGGYRAGHLPSGLSRRHTLGGLGDATFRLIPLLEQGTSADWRTIIGDYQEA